MPRLLFALSALWVLLSCTTPTIQPDRNPAIQSPAQISVPGFDEPLIHLPSAPYTPLSKPETVSDTADIDRLLLFLSLNRDTPWEASIQLNLGLAYYRNGYFSQTFKAYQRAWDLSPSLTPNCRNSAEY